MADIRFFNTNNLVIPILDYLLLDLNKRGVNARGYISHWKYRSSIKGDDQIKYFEKAGLTKLSTWHKRINQLVYAIAAALKILFSSAKLNVFFTQPPLFVIYGAWLSRMRGIPYVVHAMDLYPDLVGALGYWKRDSWIYKHFDMRMTKALMKAEAVIVIGDCMQELMLSKGIPAEKMIKVINVPSIKDKEVKISYLENKGIKNKFTILYAGNMGIAHEFRTALNAVKEFESAYPEVHFLFVGKGHRRHEVESYIEENKPKNLTLFGYLETEEFTAIMKEADLHFISLRDDFNGLLVPSKLYSTVAICKPLLYEGPASSELSLVVKKQGCGTSVKHLDGAGFKAAILKYKSDKALLDKHGKASKAYFNAECQVDDVIGRYGEFLAGLVETAV